jgi:serine phosphatase RsbU (regulator of sigma subunit)
MMKQSMKRLSIHLAFVVGIAGLALLLPWFDPPQPEGISISRAQARAIADRQARELGIDVDKAWVVTVWENSPLLVEELDPRPELREKARTDRVVGPRIGYFTTTYFRPGLEKRPEFGSVYVGTDGTVLGARRRARAETAGAKPEADALRPLADRFVTSRQFPGAPDPVFEEARPTAFFARTDHIFRYKVESDFPLDSLSYYLYVFYVGDTFAGWALIEEYSDGRAFRGQDGENLANAFFGYGVLLVLLITLLIIFLRKYHAGEVGIGTAAFVFGVALVLHLLSNAMTASQSALYTQFGGVDARSTELALVAFRFMFYDVPLAVLVFLAWSVGESYARERWGERLASFDAVFRRELMSATVGRALMNGLLASPLIAAAALLPPAIAIMNGNGYPVLGGHAYTLLSSSGGPLTLLISTMREALAISLLAILFPLAYANTRRLLPIGIAAAIIIGTAMAAGLVPLGPVTMQTLLGFGAMVAAIWLFFRADLLATLVALFGAMMLVGFLPYLRAAEGAAARVPWLVLVVPLVAILAVAAAGLMTRREIVYEYADLAPHVRRIVERERVKAEIDAANRIQAALLPAGEPDIAGVSVASHYRSATEIGGDYFDFLPLPDGKMGLAFGDVAGHGLTSGIVMAMAKSALLVQVGYDSSPRRVMEVLNETVLKTAPKRMMMTFFFGVLDPSTQQLQFSSAGHLDPFVYRARDGSVTSLSVWGFPLGVRRRDPFREESVIFEPGDKLILYSDGLIEALDDQGEPFGFQRFEKVIHSAGDGNAEELRGALLDAVRRFTRNRPPEDDQTLVVISFEEAVDAFFAHDKRLAEAEIEPGMLLN